jgi:hypothetical protein
VCAQDAREIVRRSIELEKQNRDNWINYTYLERQYSKELDGSGKVKREVLRTYDVTNVEGSPYRRLVARNDQPLSPEDQKVEQDKLQASIAARRNETKEQRDKRVAEWRRKQDRQREPINEIVDAFDFQMAGETSLDGRPAYIIDGMPRSGYRSRSMYTSFLPKLKARFWITKTDFHWVKLDAETLDTVSYGALLLRIAKGAHITMEQTPSPDGVWLPKRISLIGSARILLFKGVHMTLDYTYSNYRKFSVDSRVVSTSEK